MIVVFAASDEAESDDDAEVEEGSDLDEADADDMLLAAPSSDDARLAITVYSFLVPSSAVQTTLTGLSQPSIKASPPITSTVAFGSSALPVTLTVVVSTGSQTT